MANPHISYEVFKSRFGDLGITEWTKYNYLSNYNFGLPAQTVPNEYLELEYVDSGSGTYIDTGYKPCGGTSFRIKYKITTTAANYYYPCGVWDDVANAFLVTIGADNIFVRCGGDTNIINGNPLLNTDVSITAGLTQATINGNIYTQSNTATPDRLNHSFILFGRYNGTQVQATTSTRIYSFQIYENGILVRDFHPVRRLSDGAIGMYDTVTNSFFGNAGTGTFTAGPMKQRYVRVEYVESTGASRIDTGVVPNSNTTLELDFQYTAIGDNAINGLYNSDTDPIGQRVDIGTGNSSLWFLGAGGAITSLGPADTNRHKASVNTNTGVGVFDGVIYQAETQTFNTNRTIYLFARNRTGTAANFCKEKIYSSRIWKNGNLIRNFVPVYDLVNAEYGLYDLVEGKYYGTGGYGILTGPWGNIKYYNFSYENRSNIQYRGSIAVGINYFQIDLDDPTVATTNYGTWGYNLQNPWSYKAAAGSDNQPYCYHESNAVLSSTHNMDRGYAFVPAQGSEAADTQWLWDHPVQFWLFSKA